MRGFLIGYVVLSLVSSAWGEDQSKPPELRPAAAQVAAAPAAAPGAYTVLAWNDLGMHCISPRFSSMAILPPYNNIQAVVIRRGVEPTIVSAGVTVTYKLPQNKTFAGKTDFWTYAPKLFGKTLPVGTGLTGNTTAGKMKANGFLFEATGVPALPYNDDKTFNPYQPAIITAVVGGRTVATANIIVPVSDEMNCARCHRNGGVAAGTIVSKNMEANILTLHDQKHKTKLMKNRPILCASCHSDNALGTTGRKGVKSLSAAMHGFHATVASVPACYDCHPGVKTQCNRSAIPQMGPSGTDPQCQKCHGNLKKMAAGLAKGRRPWLDEPNCGSCHGALFATGRTLYRKSFGHGGVPCIACHNSPHVWWPSLMQADAALPMALQGTNKSIGWQACYVCHTDNRTGTVPPHGPEDADAE